MQMQASTPSALPTLIPTPSLTPKGKPNAARRLSPPKKASVGAFRGTASSPAVPVTAPKQARAAPRRPQSAPPIKEVEHPLSRSVPSLAELRKENTKPSLVRNSTYNERPRSTGSKLPGMRGASAIPMESNGNSRPAGARGAPADEKEKKRRASTRKSVTGLTDAVPEVLAPLKASKALPAEAKPNKRLSLPSSAAADSKPFLRKGRGIGPGSGPNVRKSKVAAAPEPTRAFDEKSMSDSEHEPVKADVAEHDARDSVSSIEDDKEGSVRPDLTQASQPSANGEVTSPFTSRPSTPPHSHSLALALNDDDETIRPEEWLEPEHADDLKSDEYATHAELLAENMHSSTLRHFLNEGGENMSAMNTGTVTPSQRSSPIHSIPLRALSPKGSDLPDEFHVPRDVPVSDGFSGLDVPMSLALGSPAMSPAPPPLNRSQSPDAQTSSKLRKKWLSSQKVINPPPVKDSPRVEEAAQVWAEEEG